MIEPRRRYVGSRSGRSAPGFEPECVRREHDESSARQRRTERLHRVAGEAGYLGFAERPVARVLMKRNHRRQGFSSGLEEKSLNLLAVRSEKCDELPRDTGFVHLL
jgi:hypothetical protein